MDKFITFENGVFKLKTPAQTSTGPNDAGRIVALNNQGKIDISLLPPLEDKWEFTITAIALENLNKGDIVYLTHDGTALKVGKAIADNQNRLGIGYVKEDATANNQVTVYLNGIIEGFTGLTVGAIYYLSPTQAGKITDTQPTSSGQFIQKVGVAIDRTKLYFSPEMPIYIV